MLDIPCRALAGLAVGVEPQRGDTLGHRDRVSARRGGGEIGEPAEGMQHPLDRGRGAGRAGKIDLPDR